jgi:hypothetical protein
MMQVYDTRILGLLIIPEVRNAWNSLLSNAYKCNLVIENGGTASCRSSIFLRAWYYYNVVDLFGQAPYREAGSALTLDPKVWSRSEAIFIS